MNNENKEQFIWQRVHLLIRRKQSQNAICTQNCFAFETIHFNWVIISSPLLDNLTFNEFIDTYTQTVDL